jgi:hypothetical protein
MPDSDKSTAGADAVTPTMQSQYTYAEVYKSSDEEVYKVRCLRQRLQVLKGGAMPALVQG